MGRKPSVDRRKRAVNLVWTDERRAVNLVWTDEQRAVNLVWTDEQRAVNLVWSGEKRVPKFWVPGRAEFGRKPSVDGRKPGSERPGPSARAV